MRWKACIEEKRIINVSFHGRTKYRGGLYYDDEDNLIRVSRDYGIETTSEYTSLLKESSFDIRDALKNLLASEVLGDKERSAWIKYSEEFPKTLYIVREENPVEIEEHIFFTQVLSLFEKVHSYKGKIVSSERMPTSLKAHIHGDPLYFDSLGEAASLVYTHVLEAQAKERSLGISVEK